MPHQTHQTPPRHASPAHLARWIHRHLGLIIPQRPVCPHHSAPIEYIARAYNEPATDLLVWAPRGGGKTLLGALATLLDLLHKPHCSIRILGGSLDQSLRMWEHLSPMLHKLAPHSIVGRPHTRRIELATGASAAVLTQSQRAVRGLHVQKLRCDEADMFDPRVWEAAQLVPRSRGRIGGVIEPISTCHKPGGLMQQLIDAAPDRKTPILKWCLFEVLAPCPPDRTCAHCPLHQDCQGIARTRCHGWVTIDDAIAQMRRVSRETWLSEMLCRRPVTRGRVFGSFDPAIHVTDSIPTRLADLWLAIDFGYANPFVALWVAQDDQRRAFVIDEYIQESQPIWHHIQQITSRRWPTVRHIACDPSGASVNDQTAQSDVILLQKAGFDVHYRSARIVDGIEMIRAALCPAAGPPTLFIHPRCARLRAAFASYRYPDAGGEIPLKDGIHDHPMDALRYWFVNRRMSTPIISRRY